MDHQGRVTHYYVVHKNINKYLIVLNLRHRVRQEWLETSEEVSHWHSTWIIDYKIGIEDADYTG